ncbi:sulfurtransferase [Oceanibium sediminis]|uniref:sulfurtransferase n=1 Tax=Oceanibium sediminis TaxID=2026339 RepID=UPI000DD48C9B|nr:rhodanese-like domain-containing protein [Oceanibium sediminis]
MRYLIQFTAALLLLANTALAWGPLEEPAASYDGAIVIDIRAPEAFEAGHIPGAVNTPYGLYRGPQDNPGRVPVLRKLQEVLRAAGADYGREVLVVHEGRNATDFGAAARVYWTLKSAGFGDLAVLNGGYTAWEAAGNKGETGPVTPEPSDITLSWSYEWMMGADDVQAVVNGRSEAVLIDARPLEFFKGEAKHGAAAEAGTLKGALNIVHSTWFGGDGPIVDAPEDMLARVRALAAENADAPLVSFCNTGHWAATNWFAASELAGIEGVKLYPESMVGWTLLGNEVVVGGQ